MTGEISSTDLTDQALVLAGEFFGLKRLCDPTSQLNPSKVATTRDVAHAVLANGLQYYLAALEVSSRRGLTATESSLVGPVRELSRNVTKPPVNGEHPIMTGQLFVAIDNIARALAWDGHVIPKPAMLETEVIESEVA